MGEVTIGPKPAGESEEPTPGLDSVGVKQKLGTGTPVLFNGIPVPVQHVKKKKKLYRYRSLCALVHGSVLPVPVLCPYGYCLWFAIKVFRLAGFGWR